MEYLSSYFGSAGLVVSPPRILPTSSLLMWWKCFFGSTALTLCQSCSAVVKTLVCYQPLSSHWLLWENEFISAKPTTTACRKHILQGMRSNTSILKIGQISKYNSKRQSLFLSAHGMVSRKTSCKESEKSHT